MTAAAPTMEGELVTFDEASNRHIYTGTQDKITYEFDPEKQGWFPRLTAEMLSAQQAAYRQENVDESVIYQ